MTAHELAKKLLDGPDKTVLIQVQCPKDSVSSTDEEGEPLELDIEERSDKVWISAWVSEGTFGWDD